MLFRSIIKSSVPYHREAVLGLKGSTIALDLYGWTSLRCYMLEAQNISDIFLSFQQISDQLGSSYSSNNRQFKKDLQAAFRSVSLFSPDLKVVIEKEGVRLYASQPPVKKLIKS